MILRNGTKLWRTFAMDWLILLYIGAIAAIAEYLYHYTSLKHTSLPIMPLGTLIAAVTIFLAFKVNQAYERWWEARALWGRLLNESRSLARQVTTLLTAERITRIHDEDQEKALQRSLVYRHLAFLNALRISLRKNWCLDESDWNEIGRFLGEDELASLRGKANAPTQLLQKQGEVLAEWLSRDFAEQQILLQLDETLNRLYDLQGGCERIKRTHFPDRFAFYTRIYVWVLATLIPLTMIVTEQYFDVFAVLVETFLAFVLVTTQRLGQELNDPFENKPNDTPMSAICRTAEIDLREQLGEVHGLKPLQPVKGVLM